MSTDRESAIEACGEDVIAELEAEGPVNYPAAVTWAMRDQREALERALVLAERDYPVTTP